MVATGDHLSGDDPAATGLRARRNRPVVYDAGASGGLRLVPALRFRDRALPEARWGRAERRALAAPTASC